MKDIHIAKSMENLNMIVTQNVKLDKVKEMTYKGAEKLFREGNRNLTIGDEEKAYILFTRFLLVYDTLMKCDPIFIKSILGKEHSEVRRCLPALKDSLEKRYSVQDVQEPPEKIIAEPTPNPKVIVQYLYPNGYMNCGDLYEILYKRLDIVIFDARPEEDFQKSCMKCDACVNIPESIIENGLSANTLSKQIPKESKAHWDRRWTCSLLVLVDWSSTKENFSSSKLNILREILMNWDTITVDGKMPIVLNGGYLEWLHLYPSLCTDAQILFHVQNTVLNDLLDLDTIEYPSTEDALSTNTLQPILPKHPVVDRATKPVFTDVNTAGSKKNLIKEEKELQLKIMQYEHSIQELRNKHQLEAEEGMRLELQNREEQLLADMKKLTILQEELNLENENLRNKLKAYEESKDNAADTPKDLPERDSLPAENNETRKESPKKTVTKPKPKKPRIDRRSKPNMNSAIPPGLTGLRNFGTTCYMNSVIQCMSNTDALATYFCDSKYLNDINPAKGHVTRVFADIIQQLWSGKHRVITPKNFRNVVGDNSPRFRGRDQQDAHEFFLTLTDWLHEDLRKDIKRPIQPCWTPQRKSWIEQTFGKESIITYTYSGQFKNTISCDACSNWKNKYEVFQHITLGLPDDQSCTLGYCLTKYFSKQPISGYSCPKCSSSKQVHQTTGIVLFPQYLLIVLKRFTETKENNTYTFVKNNAYVEVPLSMRLFDIEYTLYGMINHTGQLGHGHYVAVCKNSLHNAWYIFDDDKVQFIEEEKVVGGSEAYMLFFKKADVDESDDSEENIG